MNPDFDSFYVSKSVLPFRKEPFLKLQFSDPLLAGYEVVVIEDSTVENPKEIGSINPRLTTVAARFPRAILAEVNTHRVFSRNSASSRARSVKATVGAVMNDPYIPLFTKNQKGMSGLFLSESEHESAKKLWLNARNDAVVNLISLLTGEDLSRKKDQVVSNWEKLLGDYYENGYPEGSGVLSVHKQNANRLIEPFSWHEAIITSSYWQNFLELRISNAAMPEIKAMAVLVREALMESRQTTDGLHIPFIDHDNVDSSSFSSLKPALMISGTECASVSYRDKTSDSKAIESTALGERLLKMMHLSPFEHVALSAEKYSEYVAKDSSLPKDNGELLSNLDPEWIQARQIFVSGFKTRR